MPNQNEVKKIGSVRDGSSKAAILTSILTGISSFFGVPLEIGATISAGIVTFIPDSWFTIGN
jgi:hypothetical protein